MPSSLMIKGVSGVLGEVAVNAVKVCFGDGSVGRHTVAHVVYEGNAWMDELLWGLSLALLDCE